MRGNLAECLSSILTSMGIRSNSTSYTPMDHVLLLYYVYYIQFIDQSREARLPVVARFAQIFLRRTHVKIESDF